MDHKKIWYLISMKDVKAHIPKFCIFGTYIEFSSNFDAVSFFKLIAMRASSVMWTDFLNLLWFQR
jgi:hypothetical protein